MNHRGVWKAPWHGPRGELVLFALSGANRLVIEPVTVPWGADHVAICDEMWHVLDAADPLGARTTAMPPRFGFISHSRARRRRLGLQLVSDQVGHGAGGG